MIVYGDPQFGGSLSDFAQHLRSPEPGNLEELRAFLVRAGQLEQALEDASDAVDRAMLSLARELTDKAAQLLYSLFSSPRATQPGKHNSLQAVDLLYAVDRLLDNSELHHLKLVFKVPEGFEFYTLYPEQYVMAAEEWVLQIPRNSSVLVVGIRSIGTTLSALVRIVLRAHGIQASRITVRPSGHPFHRETKLGVTSGGFSHALVVDEGPGLSGSSMASVALALRSSGISKITLMPGHSGNPGCAASKEVRQCWETTPRVVCSARALVWNSKSLSQLLSDETACINGVVAEGHFKDLSAGAWRDLVSRGKAIPAAPFLERTKYFWMPRNGGRKILWKFEGLGSFNGSKETPSSRLSSAPVLGRCNGFTAYEWIEGPRAVASEKMASELPAFLARYCAESAQSPLPPEEHKGAVARLENMLERNCSELLQECPSRALADEAVSANPGPTYGDGRMGPWEWVRTEGDTMMKSDWFGHQHDHTIIGNQSVLWDAAGAIVEWDFDIDARRTFIEQLVLQGIQVTHPLLTFYCLAYAAFRAGVCQMAGDQRSLARYTGVLKSLLVSGPTDRGVHV